MTRPLGGRSPLAEKEERAGEQRGERSVVAGAGTERSGASRLRRLCPVVSRCIEPSLGEGTALSQGHSRNVPEHQGGQSGYSDIRG